MKKRISGANPFLPLWEHVPDGEPKVFTYNGETRVYLYGSHDIKTTEYCGTNQVVWSAPVSDLTSWKCHGVCYTATDGGILYAPDVVEKDGTYYLYAAEAKGSRIFVAKSHNPAGPFKDPKLTQLGFDPGILVDDDGRVYAYWGFCGCFCAELNDDMATIKPETLHKNPMGHARTEWTPDTEHIDFEDGFFEASSPRKIMGRYVYIYSKMYNTPVTELGVKGDCNGFLSYKYSSEPLNGFKKGGDISFNGGEIIELKGEKHMSYQWGNNHGSLCEINGKWYVFYHRHTGVDEYSRQAMLEPVDVALDDNGRIFIGKITYEKKDGRDIPVKSGVVDMTSSGPMINGIDAYSVISAGYACHIFRPDKKYVPGNKDNAYIQPVYYNGNPDYSASLNDKITAENPETGGLYDNPSSPVVNIQNGHTIGFKYLNFGENNSAQTVNIKLRALKALKINVRYGAYDGEIAGTGHVEAEGVSAAVKLSMPLNGRLPVYFEFLADTVVDMNEEIAHFIEFDFDR